MSAQGLPVQYTGKGRGQAGRQNAVQSLALPNTSWEVLEAQRYTKPVQFSYSHSVDSMIHNHIGKFCKVHGQLSYKCQSQALRKWDSSYDDDYLGQCILLRYFQN